ncbi:hypothetical protein [Micromonospora nigra]|nr:hypothetical protein [Micromonospora nigra]
MTRQATGKPRSRWVLLPCGRHSVTLWGNAKPPTSCDDCAPQR